MRVYYFFINFNPGCSWLYHRNHILILCHVHSYIDTYAVEPFCIADIALYTFTMPWVEILYRVIRLRSSQTFVYMYLLVYTENVCAHGDIMHMRVCIAMTLIKLHLA